MKIWDSVYVCMSFLWRCDCPVKLTIKCLLTKTNSDHWMVHCGTKLDYLIKVFNFALGDWLSKVAKDGMVPLFGSYIFVWSVLHFSLVSISSISFFFLNYKLEKSRHYQKKILALFVHITRPVCNRFQNLWVVFILIHMYTTLCNKPLWLSKLWEKVW